MKRRTPPWALLLWTCLPALLLVALAVHSGWPAAADLWLLAPVAELVARCVSLLLYGSARGPAAR
ncbi:MAG: hypothetical protein HOV96_12465 [Nonomuraea sp.]|nr:hypothetical protein [Nonomuraea sp.]NUP66772.1 hypothetical protein [Nonomuraea sp.]NUP78346.1 hypothetical protein [Nonomuraea sp.]NUS09731.1 hypothetical protein [Nonomuraea sp.]NUT11366.1 hypothetical protein [Nonomuraea sp.]